MQFFWISRNVCMKHRLKNKGYRIHEILHFNFCHKTCLWSINKSIMFCIILHQKYAYEVIASIIHYICMCCNIYIDLWYIIFFVKKTFMKNIQILIFQILRKYLSGAYQINYCSKCFGPVNWFWRWKELTKAYFIKIQWATCEKYIKMF